MIEITHHLVARLAGLKDIEPFSCNTLGLITSSTPRTLSYLATPRFIEEANNNKNIEALITNHEIAPNISKSKILIIVDDPVWLFWTLFNRMVSIQESPAPTVIHQTANVHHRAYVSDFGVTIGENSIIEPNVTIHSNVTVGKNCLVRSGTVCGFDGFEHKKTNSGIISVRHDGYVFIEDDVEIGTLNSIARGFSWRNTIVGSNTKTDSLVHIAHGVKIGHHCLITACAEISGSADIGDGCWLGPNCSIINGISLGKHVFVGIGAVVTKSFPDNSVVAGNPAKLLRTESCA